MTVKDESHKAGLKLSTQKTKIMVSDPITSWQIEGERVEAVTDFIFLGSKITLDNDCSHEIKRRLLLRLKTMANLDSILIKQDITLPTKIHIVMCEKPCIVMVFPVVMCGCESWTIKKAERWRIDAFELWRWRRLLRVPWTARRSNHYILKKINPEYSLEGLMLKLKPNTLGTWCEKSICWKRPWCWERLKAGGEEGGRGWDDWMASLTQWTWIWANSGRWWRTGNPSMLQSVGSQKVRHDWTTTSKTRALSNVEEVCVLSAVGRNRCSYQLPTTLSFLVWAQGFQVLQAP